MMEQTLKDQLKEARKASHALNRVSEEQIVPSAQTRRSMRQA